MSSAGKRGALHAADAAGGEPAAGGDRGVGR